MFLRCSSSQWMTRCGPSCWYCSVPSVRIHANYRMRFSRGSSPDIQRSTHSSCGTKLMLIHKQLYRQGQYRSPLFPPSTSYKLLILVLLHILTDMFEEQPQSGPRDYNSNDSHETENRSVSPYEHLVAQLKAYQQREKQQAVRQFQLMSSPKDTPRQPYPERCFVIHEEQESRLDFGGPCSTIQYQHASFHHADAETSDILIKEWLVSPQKEQRRTETSLRALPFFEPKENKAQEDYQHHKHFLFSTQHAFVLQLFPNGSTKTLERVPQRKGICLTHRAKRA